MISVSPIRLYPHFIGVIGVNLLPYTHPTMQLIHLTALLNDRFGIPNILRFDQHGDLTRAQITLPTCAATVYLHGAHVTHFQPTGDAPVIFLSSRSDFAPAKPIRGGIPICFPWFGSRSDGKPGPSHGFARLQDWTLTNAALTGGNVLHLAFSLEPSELSRSLGFDNFRATYEIILGQDSGRSITLRLSVVNLAQSPLHFEEALHTYFQITNIHNIELTGLESSTYIDKTDDYKTKTTPPSPLKITAKTDRVFPGATGPVAIHDEGNHRIITNTKTNSATTVTWNPWSDGSTAFTDMAPDEWLQFVAVETANTAANAITLAPNQTHTMQTTISIHPA
jgi:glucose-6-phosphate 1-epimerase